MLMNTLWLWGIEFLSTLPSLPDFSNGEKDIVFNWIWNGKEGDYRACLSIFIFQRPKIVKGCSWLC